MLASPSIRLPPTFSSDLRASILRDEYRLDPVRWVTERLGESIWSKQRDMMQSVADNRRTVSYSCHRIGKTYIMSRLAMWWIDTHKPGEAIVVTSAHSGTQVKAALWREMGRLHAKGKFPGRMNQTEWWMTMSDGHEEMIAFGRKPADNDPAAFQGTYSKYVLFLLDEGCYVPSVLWDSADTLIGNETSRIFACGNPDDPNTEFGIVCKPGSGWNVIQTSYTDTPNFTGEDVSQAIKDLLIGPTWVEEKRKKWGESNPLFISKVLGQFPQSTTGGLIPMQWVRAAQERSLDPVGDIELGVDVGGGGDKNIVACRRGPVVRIVGRDQNPDTMQTLGNVLERIKISGSVSTKVDYIGIGRGIVDRAKEMSNDQKIKRESPELAKRAAQIVGVNVGESANDTEAYVNLRAESFWDLRTRFEEGRIDLDPDDEDLAAQLVDIRYKRSGGRIQIESKDDMKRRGVPSPDDADAVNLAFIKGGGRPIKRAGAPLRNTKRA